MKVVSISELKAHLAKYLRLVRRGSEVQVCERGVPVARLVPIESVPRHERDSVRVERLVAAGILRPSEHRGDASWLLERPPVKLPGADVSGALQADREERV